MEQLEVQETIVGPIEDSETCQLDQLQRDLSGINNLLQHQRSRQSVTRCLQIQRIVDYV